MAMPQHHGRARRAARKKEKRELAKNRRFDVVEWASLSTRALVRAAAPLPHGPAFVSGGWRSADAMIPALVTVIVTRRAPGAILIPSLTLVDRTCLGVKSAFVAEPIPEVGLPAFLAGVEALSADGFEACDVLLAQSIVFHAIDYARSLGFEPHPDFAAPLLGPRPTHLLDTPLARPTRPNFISGPKDDVLAILAQLLAAVGEGNFDFTIGPSFDRDDRDDDEDLEGEDREGQGSGSGTDGNRRAFSR